MYYENVYNSIVYFCEGKVGIWEYSYSMKLEYKLYHTLSSDKNREQQDNFLIPWVWIINQLKKFSWNKYIFSDDLPNFFLGIENVYNSIVYFRVGKARAFSDSMKLLYKLYHTLNSDKNREQQDIFLIPRVWIINQLKKFSSNIHIFSDALSSCEPQRALQFNFHQRDVRLRNVL